jgi:soluble lytic murein transglycosylase-like protein
MTSISLPPYIAAALTKVIGTKYQRLEANRAIFEQAGRRYGFCPCLLAGLAWTESKGVRMAVNPDSGAAGIMQIYPTNFQMLGWQRPTSVDRASRTGAGGSGWYDPGENIMAGAGILKGFHDRYSSLLPALQGYVGAATFGSVPPGYMDSVFTSTIQLAGFYAAVGKWSD